MTEKDKVTEAKGAEQLALSCDGIIVGKNMEEGDVLYSYMTVDELKRWEGQLTMLDEEGKTLFEEIRRTLRKYF